MSEAIQPQGTSDDTKSIITVLLLVFFFPLGMILMWVWTKWPLWLKVTITCISILMTIFSLVIVGIFFVGFMSAFDPKGRIETARKMSEERHTQTTMLESIDGDTYTFYYPSGYVETDPGENEATQFYSKSNSIYGEGMSLIIHEKTSRLPVPSDTSCQSAALESAKQQHGSIIQASAVQDELTYGCEVLAKTTLSGTDDDVIIHYKEVWYKAGKDYDTYGAMATYFSKSPDSRILTEAVKNFELK